MWSGIKRAHKSRGPDESSICCTYEASIFAKTGLDGSLAWPDESFIFFTPGLTSLQTSLIGIQVDVWLLGKR